MITNNQEYQAALIQLDALVAKDDPYDEELIDQLTFQIMAYEDRVLDVASFG